MLYYSLKYSLGSLRAVRSIGPTQHAKFLDRSQNRINNGKRLCVACCTYCTARRDAVCDFKSTSLPRMPHVKDLPERFLLWASHYTGIGQAFPTWGACDFYYDKQYTRYKSENTRKALLTAQGKACESERGGLPTRRQTHIHATRQATVYRTQQDTNSTITISETSTTTHKQSTPDKIEYK